MADALDPIRKLRHDLSNPLAAILAETQLLLLGADKYDAETITSLKQIEALSRKMRDILEALDRGTGEPAAPATALPPCPLLEPTAARRRARSPGALDRPPGPTRAWARRTPAPPEMKMAVSSNTPCPAMNVAR